MWALGLVTALVLGEVQVQSDAIKGAGLGDLARGSRTALLVVNVMGGNDPAWQGAGPLVGAAVKAELAASGLAVLKAPGPIQDDNDALEALKDSGADIVV